jgi:hypothetical protein
MRFSALLVFCLVALATAAVQYNVDTRSLPSSLSDSVRVTSDEDWDPPTITDFDFDPKTITDDDVIAGGYTVTGSFIADDASGTNQVDVWFVSEETGTSVDCTVSDPGSDGYDYTFSCYWGVEMPDGIWVPFVDVSDMAGNWNSIDLNDFPGADELSLEDGQSDVEAPTCNNIDINKNDVEVTDSSESVTISFSCGDDYADDADVSVTVIYAWAGDATESLYDAGTANDDDLSITFDSDTFAGYWDGTLMVSDGNGNYRVYSLDSVFVTNDYYEDYDDDFPSCSSANLSPTNLDVTDLDVYDSRDITVSVTCSDDNLFQIWVYLEAPGHLGDSDTFSEDFLAVQFGDGYSGLDDNDAPFEGSVMVYNGYPDGTYEIRAVIAMDDNYNLIVYGDAPDSVWYDIVGGAPGLAPTLLIALVSIALSFFL